MIQLNYNHLDAETQDRLLLDSKKEIEQKIGEELRTYATENQLCYNDLLEEEAIKNLYTYTFNFRI